METSSAENAKDIKTIAEASGKPSAEVAMLREIVGTMAAQSQQQHNEYREERREMREELRTTWQRIDGLVDTVGQTNKHLARIQGALGT